MADIRAGMCSCPEKPEQDAEDCDDCIRELIRKAALFHTEALVRSVEERTLREAAKELRSVYSTWHACALSRRDARKMKQPLGRLCDVCEEMIAAHVADVKERSRLASLKETRER